MFLSIDPSKIDDVGHLHVEPPTRHSLTANYSQAAVDRGQPDMAIQVFLGTSYAVAYMDVDHARILRAALDEAIDAADNARMSEDSDDFPAQGPWGCDDVLDETEED